MVLVVAVVRASPHSKVSPARNSKLRRPAPPTLGDGGLPQHGTSLSSIEAPPAATSSSRNLLHRRSKALIGVVTPENLHRYELLQRVPHRAPRRTSPEPAKPQVQHRHPWATPETTQLSAKEAQEQTPLIDLECSSRGRTEMELAGREGNATTCRHHGLHAVSTRPTTSTLSSHVGRTQT